MYIRKDQNKPYLAGQKELKKKIYQVIKMKKTTN